MLDTNMRMCFSIIEFNRGQTTCDCLPMQLHFRTFSKSLHLPCIPIQTIYLFQNAFSAHVVQTLILGYLLNGQ